MLMLKQLNLLILMWMQLNYLNYLMLMLMQLNYLMFQPRDVQSCSKSHLATKDGYLPFRRRVSIPPSGHLDCLDHHDRLSSFPTIILYVPSLLSSQHCQFCHHSNVIFFPMFSLVSIRHEELQNYHYHLNPLFIESFTTHVNQNYYFSVSLRHLNRLDPFDHLDYLVHPD